MNATTNTHIAAHIVNQGGESLIEQLRQLARHLFGASTQAAPPAADEVFPTEHRHEHRRVKVIRFTIYGPI